MSWEDVQIFRFSSGSFVGQVQELPRHRRRVSHLSSCLCVREGRHRLHGDSGNY